ncbi:hypothetical protein V8E53_000698 [Lactarius tabidus]
MCIQDFQNPVVIEKDFLALVKLFHVVDGIFMCDLSDSSRRETWTHTLIPTGFPLPAGSSSSLSIMNGASSEGIARAGGQYGSVPPSTAIYSLARVCTLIIAILSMLAFDSPNPINCQLRIIFELIFASLAFAAASSLIVLRIIAIWNRNGIAVAIAISTWGTNVAFLIHNIALLRSAWEPVQSFCVVLNPERTKKAVIAGLITDVVLLLTMLIGLLRMRLHGTMFSLGQLLWNQGLIWLFLATVAEVPPAVFISLNLNGKINDIASLTTENNKLDLDGKTRSFQFRMFLLGRFAATTVVLIMFPLLQMFQIPAIIGMSICATRMYRSLTDFTNPKSFDNYLPSTGHTANAHPKRIFSAPVAVSRVEVAVHTSSEAYPPTMKDQRVSYGSYSADSQSQDKPLELGFYDDVENCVERV